MNHPNSSCRLFREELLGIATSLEQAANLNQHTTASFPANDVFEASMDVSLGGFSTDSPAVEDWNMDCKSSEALPSAFSSLSAAMDPVNRPSFVKETYPGASSVYGLGETFIDGFDADCHHGQRNANKYYPFASRYEWELAFFLIRSCKGTTS